MILLVSGRFSEKLRRAETEVGVARGGAKRSEPDLLKTAIVKCRHLTSKYNRLPERANSKVKQPNMERLAEDGKAVNLRKYPKGPNFRNRLRKWFRRDWLSQRRQGRRQRSPSLKEAVRVCPWYV